MKLIKRIGVLSFVLIVLFVNATAEETYDVIVLGTGIKECILSGMLSKAGKKVLHIEKNKHYGGEFVSFSPLDKLFAHFNSSFSEYTYVKAQSWTVDIIPKFMETNGKFLKLLTHVGLAQYLQVFGIGGSFVYEEGKLTKVSSKEGYEPLVFPLFGLGDMVQACSKISEIQLGKPVDEVTSNENGVVVKSGSEVFKAKQVYCDPSYAPNLVKKTGKVKQTWSWSQQGQTGHMLTYGQQCFTAYFDRSFKVVRAICLQNQPLSGTRDASSAQVIIPHKQTGRKNDIHISYLGSQHQVAPNSWFIGTVSTTVETDNPEGDIQKGIVLFGRVEKKFVTVSDFFEPVDDGTSSKIFISKSVDSTTNFETVAEEVLQLFKKGTLEDFNLSKIKTGAEENSDW